MNHSVSNANQPCDRLSLSKLTRSQAGTYCSYCHGAITECQLSRFGDHSRINATRKRDRYSTIATDYLQQLVTFSGEVFVLLRHGYFLNGSHPPWDLLHLFSI